MSETNLPSVEITTKNTVALTLGIIATVIGVIALLIGWVPFLGLFAIPGAIIGLILAIVGIVLAMTKKGKGIGLPILGCLICLGALILPILSTGGASVAFSKALADANNKQTADAKVSVVPNSGTVASPASGDQHAANPSPASPKIVWNDASSALRLGDVQIQVRSAKVGNVAVKDMFGAEKQSNDELMAITVEVSNLSTGKKIDFSTWQGETMGFDAAFASLSDDNENTYKRINFGAAAKVIGSVDNESIYPGKTVADILVFEKPVDTVKWLHLELPAKNFKGEGVIRFQIPASMISK